MILYNRKKVKYRKDGYCWKKRKDGKTTREDHMKLKVQGVEVGDGSGVWVLAGLGGSGSPECVQWEVVHTLRKIFVFAEFQFFSPYLPEPYVSSFLLL